MFTGIIEAAVPVRGVKDRSGVKRIELDLWPLEDWESVKLGDSVAVNGCCLTVASLSESVATFEAIPETLSLTNLKHLTKGALVNVERAMKAGSRLDGHIVQGHVDAIAEVQSIDDLSGEWRITVKCGKEFARTCILKGSVCLDGISLTIAELTDASLTVAVIPHTRQITNIKSWKPTTTINLEADVLGKYVQTLLANLADGGLEDLLKRA
ncbi:MAG: riboflavin synthase, partial [Planctomycetota bacterium]